MQKLKSFTIIFIFVIAALGLMISTARAAVVTVDGAGQLIGATNVDLGSLGFFNVSFLDGTCIDLFFGCDADSDFAFASEADAQTAAQALLDQVFIDTPPSQLFDTDPELTVGCGATNTCFSFIPYGLGIGLDGPFVLLANSRNHEAEILDAVSLTSNTPGFSTAFVSAQTYAVFSPVPLPPAALLFVSALAGLGLMGWRRRQAGA